VSRLLAARALQGVFVAFVVAALTFFLVKAAPGDPFGEALSSPGVDASMRDRWREAWGLDRPAPEKFVRWLGSVARGDFGYSFSQRRPVLSAVGEALPYSVLLMGASLIASVVIGVGIALIQARRRRSRLDRLLGVATLVGVAAPEAWIALALLATFALALPWFPVGGAMENYGTSPWSPRGALDIVRHIVLPTLSICIVGAAVVARHQRAALIATAPAEFVRAARARGIPEGAIWRRHILRNALAPLLTLIGLALPSFAGGAVFAERIFAWPGMGLLATQAVTSRDAPLLTACVFLSSLLVVAGSITADLLHAWIDPRVRHADG
jgi:peptide/nickel transport system permease protein